jgi:glycosyltransferase involved in cell wall biosynthesis
MPGLRRPGRTALRSVAALRRLIREVGAALLHANGSRAMAYAGLAGCLARRPVIWHVRVAQPDRLLDKLLLRLASAVVVNSNAVGGRFAWAPPEKVRRIYNGVDLTRFSPRQPSAELRAALALPDGALVVASVGRFVLYKGYAYLLEAARRVQDSRSGVHWVLIGDGELRGELERRCQDLGLSTQVHFTGWREDVPDILALCDLFVLPSLTEHFGRVLIEAMAMGKAVVATNGGGVPEIVRQDETGLLVPPAQSKALAEAVLALLEDPARAARLGTAGRRRAETAFSLASHVAAVQSLYGEIAGEGPGAV